MIKVFIVGLRLFDYCIRLLCCSMECLCDVILFYYFIYCYYFVVAELNYVIHQHETKRLGRGHWAMTPDYRHPRCY
jgi:hypothetical protein